MKQSYTVTQNGSKLLFNIFFQFFSLFFSQKYWKSRHNFPRLFFCTSTKYFPPQYVLQVQGKSLLFVPYFLCPEGTVETMASRSICPTKSQQKPRETFSCLVIHSIQSEKLGELKQKPQIKRLPPPQYSLLLRSVQTKRDPIHFGHD